MLHAWASVFFADGPEPLRQPPRGNRAHLLRDDIARRLEPSSGGCTFTRERSARARDVMGSTVISSARLASNASTLSTSASRRLFPQGRKVESEVCHEDLPTVRLDGSRQCLRQRQLPGARNRSKRLTS
jgi:hypothetical protein